MLFFDGSFLIYDSETKFRASQLSQSGLEAIGGKTLFQLVYHEPTGLVLPFMKNKPLSLPNSCNIPNWFRDMIQNSDKVEIAKGGLGGFLKQQNVSFTDEDVNAIVNIPLEAKANKNSPVAKNILEFSVGDMRATSLLQQRILVDDVSYPHPNEKFKQLEPTDKLGVHLPEADIITTHVLGEEYLESSYPSSYTPYPNRLYKFRNIVNILSAKTPEERSKQIKEAINVLVNDYQADIKEQERRKLEVKFETLPIEYVLGNPDNDTLDIQDNERDFYENLCAFIKYHIKKFNEEVMAGASEEEINKKTEEDFSTGNLPLRLTEYFEQLLYDSLSSNFYHTSNFNFRQGDFNDEGDDNSNSTDDSEAGLSDKAGLLITKADRKKSDLQYTAASYLYTSAKRFGASVWAEGIIKTMRWGDRKIRNLNVGLNNTQYLDLQTMNLVTQQIADLSQFNVISENGKTLEVLMHSYVDLKPASEKRPHSYPFLLLGQEYGTIPGIDEEISVTYLLTLFDIVRSYEKGQGQVLDLDFINGKFVSTYNREPLDELSFEQAKLGNRKVKVLDELMDYALDNAIPKMNGTAFSIIRSSDFEMEKSTEPILEELVNTGKTLRSALVQSRFLGIFNEGGMDYSSDNLDELLNWYYENVYPTHKELYEKVFGLADLSGGTQLNARNIPTANFFGQGQGTEADSNNEEEKEKPFMYHIYEMTEEELASTNFNKITQLKGGEGRLIGGYIERDGLLIFASTKEITNFDIGGKTLHLGEVLLKMFEVTLAANPDNEGYTTKYRTISNSTIMDMHRTLYGK